MAFSVQMPALGESVTEGTVTRWLKQVGDTVEVDDSLFEVSTDKVETEVPSAVQGVLRQILVAEGDTVPIGTPLAVITATADEPLDDVAAPLPPPASDGTRPTAATGAPAPDRRAVALAERAPAPRPPAATAAPVGAESAQTDRVLDVPQPGRAGALGRARARA
jgi:pyruvate dehydrogenase E2 component (dihydrolipoamide acetyltransferase)